MSGCLLDEGVIAGSQQLTSPALCGVPHQGDATRVMGCPGGIDAQHAAAIT